jgi:hypothetical protein
MLLRGRKSDWEQRHESKVKDIVETITLRASSLNIVVVDLGSADHKVPLRVTGRSKRGSTSSAQFGANAISLSKIADFIFLESVRLRYSLLDFF